MGNQSLEDIMKRVSVASIITFATSNLKSKRGERMLAREAMELTKKFTACPECGNDKVGGEPSQGALIIEDDVFTRSCKCGWSIVVDKRIKVIASATKKFKGQTTGIVEIRFHDKKSHKYVDMNELKSLSGAKRSNQTKKMEEWLNTQEGRTWAKETHHCSAFFL